MTDLTSGRNIAVAEPHQLQNGEVMFWVAQGRWMARTPNGHLANLSRHEVTEHEDGTITVSPSISVTAGGIGEVYHGYLERGEWRSV